MKRDIFTKCYCLSSLLSLVSLPRFLPSIAYSLFLSWWWWRESKLTHLTKGFFVAFFLFPFHAIEFDSLSFLFLCRSVACQQHLYPRNWRLKTNVDVDAFAPSSSSSQVFCNVPFYVSSHSFLSLSLFISSYSSHRRNNESMLMILFMLQKLLWAGWRLKGKETGEEREGTNNQFFICLFLLSFFFEFNTSLGQNGMEKTKNNFADGTSVQS